MQHARKLRLRANLTSHRFKHKLSLHVTSIAFEIWQKPGHPSVRLKLHSDANSSFWKGNSSGAPNCQLLGAISAPMIKTLNNARRQQQIYWCVSYTPAVWIIKHPPAAEQTQIMRLTRERKVRKWRAVTAAGHVVNLHRQQTVKTRLSPRFEFCSRRCPATRSK